jgi:hypothetical protein
MSNKSKAKAAKDSRRPPPLSRSLLGRLRDWLPISDQVLGIVQKALAVIAAAGVAVPLIYQWFWPSCTSIDFSDATTDVIRIKVANHGPRKSTLTGNYLLHFPPDLQFADVLLKRARGDVGDVNERNESREIALTVDELEIDAGKPPVRLAPDDVLTRIRRVPTEKMTVTVSVRESNGKTRAMTATPTVDRLVRFIDGRMSRDEYRP